MHRKLTKKLIDETPFPVAGQTFLRDGLLSGFALRITPKRKVFILEKRVQGRNRRMAIGPYGPITVEEARRLAQQLVGGIARGLNPADEKIDRRREMTFGEYLDHYVARHAEVKNKPSSLKSVRSIIDRHLSGWRGRKLSSITRRDAAELHARIGTKAPVRANRTIALLRRVFNVAKMEGVFDADNPAAKTELFKEVSRDRFIQPEELPEFVKALAQEESPFIRALFLVLIFTGARRSEALGMKWRDVDLTRAVWRIRETKQGRPHTIPVPEVVVNILKSLPRFEGNDHVFPGTGNDGTGPLNNIHKPWVRICKRAKLKDIRPHDLRRTLGSWLASSGESLILIGKTLGHATPASTAIYARMNLDPVRRALEENAARMIAVAGELPGVALLPESEGTP